MTFEDKSLDIYLNEFAYTPEESLVEVADNLSLAKEDALLRIDNEFLIDCSSSVLGSSSPSSKRTSTELSDCESSKVRDYTKTEIDVEECNWDYALKVDSHSPLFSDGISPKDLLIKEENEGILPLSEFNFMITQNSPSLNSVIEPVTNADSLFTISGPQPLPQSHRHSSSHSYSHSETYSKKAIIVGDYVTKNVPGDGKFEKLIEDYLLPHCSFNYLSNKYFQNRKKEGAFGSNIIFDINSKSRIPRTKEEDPGRFSVTSGTDINFYEPSIFRCHLIEEFKRQGREGLCPYCKLSERTGDNVDGLFFNMNSSAYLHHVTKQHGVFSNGTEMPLPVAIGSIKETKQMKKGVRTNIVDAATCPFCQKKVKIQKLDDHNLDGHNRFLGYFRHLLVHNMRKKNKAQ
ncbi:hypothetical protein FOA43_001501 [Brettanomyces nanus]|uniref:Transcription regulator Rua1 C-terminal domain-containing protein n=1 Tax=Eeniella nana TaxID=13502 RepID=A0A875RU44_EENNA|nr:uncharacterized protein FOA43_001501 [Brettanomyces nanus]QPG74177.1 hypothetical protein FOA43_001501 [Brettanomyces nanus]